MESRNVRARAGVSGAYFVQGLCFAGLLTQVPSLKDKFSFKAEMDDEARDNMFKHMKAKVA